MKKPEHIFRNITDSINDGILLIDRTYKITFANDPISRIFGNENSIIGKTCHSLLHQLDIPCHEKYDSKACPNIEILASGKLEGTNRIYIFNNGTKRILNITTLPVLDNNGKVMQIAKIMKDITEQKKIEEITKKQEILLSSILEGMHDGMIVVNKDFEILYANKSYIKQTGLSPDEIKGRHCYEVSHHNEKPCYLEGEECSVRNAFETGFSNKIIHTHLDIDNNPVYVETVAYPLKDFSGNVVSVAERVSNITEKIKLEGELKERIAELEEFYEMAVGRELKMIELKEEIEKLKTELKIYKKGGNA